MLPTKIAGIYKVRPPFMRIYIRPLFFRPKFQGISPENMVKSQTYGTFTYLHVLDPEDLPLTNLGYSKGRSYHYIVTWWCPIMCPGSLAKFVHN